MEKEHKGLLPNPRNYASFVSRMTFWWLLPLLRKGYSRPIEKEDMYEVQHGDHSQLLGDQLTKCWERELAYAKKQGKKPSYVRALFRNFGVYYAFLGIFVFVEECIIRIVQPVFLGLLIRFFSNATSETPRYTGWLYATGIVGGAVAYIFSHHPYFFRVQILGMRIRVASCCLVYKKALRLSKASLGQTTVGQMVNLLSNDVNRFDTSVIFLHYVWVGPLQSIIVTAILWQELGPSCLAGVVLLLLFVPLQSYMGKVFSRLRLRTAGRTDERVRLMNETVNAMRVIKMYAWEIPFTKMLELARKKEIDVILKTNYYRALNMSLFFTSSKVIVFLALLTYVLTGNILTAEKVFVTTALITNVRLAMTLFFPFAITMGSETLISCRRIQEFLEMEEREECNRVETSPERPQSENCALECQKVKARWKMSPNDVISDLTFHIKSEEILAIIGSIGSGKSSLLQAILGELPIHDGNIRIQGKVSYAAQEPWLFSGSLKDNILFGQEYDSKKYQEVIKACSLERDLEILPNGDRTTVGERGVSLSGGQKARINLARAVYFDADIYLLDDPLSAVDAHVGKRLYEDCIMGFLKKKVRILVTHQIQYLKDASKILVLNDGYEEAMGSYRELVAKGIDFSLLTEEEDGKNVVNFTERQTSLTEQQLITRVTRLRRDSEAWMQRRGSRTSLSESILDDNVLMSISKIGLGTSTSSIDKTEVDLFDEEGPNELQKAVGVEQKKIGSISGGVYWGYLMAGGGYFMVLLLFVLSIITQILFSGSDVWLSYWTNQEQERNRILIGDTYFIPLNSSEISNLSDTVYEDSFFNFNRLTYIYVYTGMTVLLFVTSLGRTILFFVMCMTSSRTLHNRMLYSLLRAPISFFDSHPIGIILNRFTKDMGQVDDLLPQNLYDFIEILLVFLGIIVVISTVSPWIAVPTIALALVFVFLRRFYIRSARDIKRLEGITRSPVFSHLSTTLHGLTTIRAFEAQNQLINEFDSYQDIHSSTWFLFLSTTRWFGICLDVMTCIYLAIVTFSFMGSSALGGDVGLAISSAMMLSGMFQWGVRQSAEVENQMTSVERIIEYSKLPSEEPPPKKKESPNPDKDIQISKEWPTEGKVVFNDVSLRYNEYDPPVLKNLRFTVKPGRKVGIVGRTGAGKSSLLTCLFRLTEPEGVIEIDGVQISTLPLQKLRSSISIIPQEPTLFSGTLRYNLDPFSIYPDEKLWNVLEEVQLQSIASEASKGLEADIQEGGSNLSVGQRQLVCLARAILKRSKVLVMDEATANVDQKTDALIQNTIRENFKDCTVLTIAHRLNTIIDCDRVMVMSAGRLMEYEEPYLLLQNKKSIFSALVVETGVSSANLLHKIAKDAFHRRHQQVKDILESSRDNVEIPNGTCPSGEPEHIQFELDESEHTKL